MIKVTLAVTEEVMVVMHYYKQHCFSCLSYYLFCTLYNNHHKLFDQGIAQNSAG